MITKLFLRTIVLVLVRTLAWTRGWSYEEMFDVYQYTITEEDLI